jgi:hypothetical protein
MGRRDMPLFDDGRLLVLSWGIASCVMYEDSNQGKINELEDLCCMRMQKV